jgi:hypothetical protein
MRNVRVQNFVVCIAGDEIILRMGFLSSQSLDRMKN